MIYFNFSIYWPFSKRREQIDYIIKCWPLTKNKSLELQVSSWGNSWTLIGLEIRPSFRQSHAGLFLEFELFNYALIINFYDNRHWDYEKGEWEKYEDK